VARCPQCGETVSQFAAGCAVCGADLEAARREQARRRAARPAFLRGGVRLPRLPGVPDAVLTLVLLTILTLAFPLAGAILCVIAARRSTMTSQVPLRNALIVVAIVGVVLLIGEDTRYGVLWNYS
jgi:hypothetical protein